VEDLVPAVSILLSVYAAYNGAIPNHYIPKIGILFETFSIDVKYNFKARLECEDEFSLVIEFAICGDSG
jgi:hypothetical protein